MLLGNLGADPELRSTAGGQAVLKLRLATTESYLDRNRARQERTDWHSIVVWGKRAEALSRILNKGSRLFVEGSIRTSSYDDRDGNKRYKTEVIATNIILCGGRSGGGRDDFEGPSGGGVAGGGASGGTGGGAPPASGGGGFDDADYGGGRDDDFPF
jgi:single-strand DNA-binding protein